MSSTFTRAAALLELDGNIVLLQLSSAAWHQVLAIAAQESGDGRLPVAMVPNQAVLDLLDRAVLKGSS
ncbi:hypothetical protein [Chitinimonas koreensis]|uniref:hypothetical protein n=1 Tax=Chitinimonas koreensis TaxID=356302 RepID=UPI00048C088B|nr:hypothetical protein [Chitinimonas koreensis]QNM95448.1 hypothetical protein H9L41_16465 [Chitinimonas koreensis]